MTVYFITGTDTDCGKTYATCRLLDYFLAKERKVLAIKPIVSGIKESNWEDLVHLKKHNPPFIGELSSFKFKLPLSPHLAANSEGQSLHLKSILDFCKKEEFQDFETLLVEGAGGLVVPLNEEETWLDFLKLSQMEVIIVVAMRLGCLNHALLTDIVLKLNQIKIKGWIANCIDPTMLSLMENIETLERKMSAPLLGIIDYAGSFRVKEGEERL